MSGAEDEQQEPEQPQQQQVELVLPENMAGGVWSNVVFSNQSAHEITLDFCRQDPHVPTRVIVVARVSFSPVLLAQLQDLLGRAWQTWSTQQLGNVPEIPPETEPEPGEPE